MFVRYKLGYQILLTLAALEFAIAFSFGTAPLSTYYSLNGFVTLMLPGWVLLPLLWSGNLAIQVTQRRVDRPLSAVRRMLYLHRHWLGRGLLFILMILLLARAFTSYKSAIPQYQPFFADPWLAEFDRSLFGTDPWRLTHTVIGPIGTVFIDRVYAIWFLIMMLYLGWFSFTRNQKLQVRGLLTYLLTWAILGNLCAVLLSSVGPCFFERFYGEPRFAELMFRLREIDEQHQIVALNGMYYLEDSIGKDRFGAGISAMPSLHVAIAFLCFLVAWEYGRHWWAKLLGFLFFAIIAVGSVHLGWHYAVDGIVSVIGVGLIWWGTGRFMVWLERREAAQQAGPGEGGGIPVPA